MSVKEGGPKVTNGSGVLDDPFWSKERQMKAELAEEMCVHVRGQSTGFVFHHSQINFPD
jgi:hypothetical protein